MGLRIHALDQQCVGAYREHAITRCNVVVLSPLPVVWQFCMGARDHSVPTCSHCFEYMCILLAPRPHVISMICSFVFCRLASTPGTGLMAPLCAPIEAPSSARVQATDAVACMLRLLRTTFLAP